MKSASKIPALSVFFLLTLVMSNSSFLQKSYASSFEIDEWIEYTVLEANNDTNFFYGAWPPGTFFGNWSVSDGELIRFTITYSDIFGINGTLSAGNYTFNDVRNIDAASAMAISIYPWNGGFFANSSDWEAIEIQIENTNTSIEVDKNVNYQINDLTRYFEVIRFNTIDYYGQNSTFSYDRQSGVLLNAKTSFNNYLLSISLSNSSLELGLASKTYNLDSTSAILFVFSFFVILILKRKIWK